MLIRRIDHPIICVRERKPWVEAFRRVLDLEPLHAREGDEWGFSNAEIAVGDGFVGVVEPAGEGSLLDGFLARYGEGYYALSVDVGDLKAAGDHFARIGVPFREAKRAGETRLLWPSPKATGQVLFQVSPGMQIEPGTNPLYLGIPEVAIAVEDLERGRALFQTLFAFETVGRADSAELGYRGYRLPIPGAAFDEALIIAAPADPDGALARHIKAKGQSLFQFTIDVKNLGEDLERLHARGVAVKTSHPGARPQLAWIAPEHLRGVRVELRQA
jgi:hypothetical protein